MENRYMTDKDQIACEQEHEIEYVLKKLGKSRCKENIDRLKEACRNFKHAEEYQPHNRDQFYKYLDDFNITIILKR